MMKRRWRLWLGVVLLVLVGGSFLVPQIRWPVYGWLRGESFYRGMPTSYWRETIRIYYVEADDWSPHVIPAALEVPLNTGQIETHIHPRGPRTPNKPSWIVGLLRSWGFRGPPEMPDIFRLNQPEATAVLIELLTDDNDMLSANASEALGQRGAHAKAAVPALLEVLHHPNSTCRQQASLALCCIIPEDAAAVAGLTAALDDEDVSIAYWSARALGQMGSKAKAAVPALTKVWQSKRASNTVPYSYMRHSTTLGRGVAIAIQQIDPDAALNAGIH